jgi:hypothetical protein
MTTRRGRLPIVQLTVGLALAIAIAEPAAAQEGLLSRLSRKIDEYFKETPSESRQDKTNETQVGKDRAESDERSEQSKEGLPGQSNVIDWRKSTGSRSFDDDADPLDPFGVDGTSFRDIAREIRWADSGDSPFDPFRMDRDEPRPSYGGASTIDPRDPFGGVEARVLRHPSNSLVQHSSERPSRFDPFENWSPPGDGEHVTGFRPVRRDAGTDVDFDYKFSSGSLQVGGNAVGTKASAGVDGITLSVERDGSRRSVGVGVPGFSARETWDHGKVERSVQTPFAGVRYSDDGDTRSLETSIGTSVKANVGSASGSAELQFTGGLRAKGWESVPDGPNPVTGVSKSEYNQIGYSELGGGAEGSVSAKGSVKAGGVASGEVSKSFWRKIFDFDLFKIDGTNNPLRRHPLDQRTARGRQLREVLDQDRANHSPKRDDK